MTENKLLNEFLDINKKPLDERGYFYDMDIAYKSVEIADEFAIGFAIHISTHCNCELGNDTRSYKELLEIYKKEKGL